jgi:hypothetical protein
MCRAMKTGVTKRAVLSSASVCVYRERRVAQHLTVVSLTPRVYTDCTPKLKALIV